MQRRGHAGMFGSQLLLIDAQCLLEELFGLCILPLIVGEACQTDDYVRHQGMLGSQVLADAQRPLEKGLGLRMLSQLRVESRQVVERSRYARMGWLELWF